MSNAPTPYISARHLGSASSGAPQRHPHVDRLPIHVRAQRGSDRTAHHGANRADLLGVLMNEGRKDDARKPQLDLLRAELVMAIARVLTVGTTKCGDRNWERVVAWGHVFGTVQRYLWAW